MNRKPSEYLWTRFFC